MARYITPLDPPIIDHNEGIGNLGVYGDGNYQIFTYSGDFSVPQSKKYRVRVFGAGGGGGRCSGNGTLSAGGGGGGGGAFGVLELFLKKGGIIPVIVGSGGLSNTDGGLSSFGHHITAMGGSGGAQGLEGELSLGGSGGVCVGGDLNTQGGKGGNAGIPVTTVTAGGGGGGSATQLGNGGDGGDSHDGLGTLEVNFGGNSGAGGGAPRGRGGNGLLKMDPNDGFTNGKTLNGGAGASPFGSALGSFGPAIPSFDGVFDERFGSSCFYPQQNLFGGRGGYVKLVQSHRPTVSAGAGGRKFCGGGSAGCGYISSSPFYSGNGGTAAGGAGQSGWDGWENYKDTTGRGGNGLIIVEW